MNEGTLYQLRELRHQSEVIARKIRELTLGCDHKLGNGESAKGYDGVNYEVCSICYKHWPASEAVRMGIKK
jgi:hypothetical protein